MIAATIAEGVRFGQMGRIISFSAEPHAPPVPAQALR
jgi:hypothetical protein